MALHARLQRLSATTFTLLVLGTGAALADCQSDFMTSELRDKICAAAANGAGAAGAGGPPKPPPQGSMSSALGVTTGYVPGQSGTGGGIFDTLNGNALKN
ncbi:MAG: hypothetical protein B7Z15_11855 [Rhizobiales bacterium 32-66-8]|nr:MAG: hypothetical protein B7Z15_11855 [Rhizobiales bacterium 32-66-8]